VKSITVRRVHAGLVIASEAQQSLYLQIRECVGVPLLAMTNGHHPVNHWENPARQAKE
jgi:hypothetical protein